MDGGAIDEKSKDLLAGLDEPAAVETAMPAPPSARPDWARIEAEVRAGGAVREIARREGVSHTAINKRAHAGGWCQAFQREVSSGRVETKVETGAIQTARAPLAAAWRDDDLWKSESEDLIVAHQHATAVYMNPYGQIILRQEGEGFEDEDQFVIISRANMPAILEQIDALMKVPGRKR